MDQAIGSSLEFKWVDVGLLVPLSVWASRRPRPIVNCVCYLELVELSWIQLWASPRCPSGLRSLCA